MDNTSKVGQNMFVAFAYRLTDEKTGNLLFEVSKEAPDTMVYGVTQEIIPGLIAAIDGLKAGDKFSTTLPPEAAFGQRYEENILKLEKEIFTVDGELAEEVKVNAQLPMMTEQGVRVMGTVIEISDTHVTMDFNHPFADITVHYEGEIIEVRPATAEELQPQHGCGGCGGGCGSKDGNCGDHSCGNGCCGGC